ncbi:hypothetical protein FO519_008532 [Halicephalobus sp. NKZ332]|nr:hypothetical protein FO519_008532 [Halicephalobus sp. NKZ332]
MSASPEGSASPMSPRRPIEEFPRQSVSISEDPSLLVERKITDLAEQLGACITELSKDKQITNKKMEELATGMKKSLADIENGLHEQLNLMEESLMSGDFNCCPPLNDHQIETVDEMARALRMHLTNAIPKRKPVNDEDLDGFSDMDMDSEEAEDSGDRGSPKLLMDPALVEQSILRAKDGRSLPGKIDDNVKFSKKVHKRLYHDSEEEDLERKQEEVVERFAKLPSRARMIRSMMETNPSEEDLSLRETLYRAEGLSLLGQEVREDLDEEEDLDPVSPMNDEARKIEKQITELKKEYQASKNYYEDQLEALEEEGKSAGEDEKKYVETLKVEMKTKKALLRTMLNKRNIVRGFTSEDLEKRKEEKLARKVAMLEKTGTLEEGKSNSEIEEDPELLSSSSDEDISSKRRKQERGGGNQGESSKKKTLE